MPARSIQRQIQLRRATVGGGTGRLGRVTPRKRPLPLGKQPRGPAVEYARAIRRVLARLQENLAPLLKDLPTLLENAKAERERFDVGESREIQARIAEALRRTQQDFNGPALEALALEFAQKTQTIQRTQLLRQTRSALGVDVLLAEPRITAVMNDFVIENVSLIKDIPVKVAGEIERTLTRAITEGKLRKDVASDIQKRFAVGRKRAELIARDQIGKFHGQLNATRQRALGVTKFIWRTSNDERVRDEHQDREGVTFSYDDPPSDGLPGEPINCRCWAEPVFDDLLAT